MASNITLGYHTLRETSRHNQITEAETMRHNLVTEDQGYKDLDQRLNIANADRASRENIANLDRVSREKIANADRASRERIAAADRTSRENIASSDRTSRENIASLDRQSRQSIAQLQADTTITKTNLDNAARSTLQDDQQQFSDEQRRNQNTFDIIGYDPNAPWYTNLVTTYMTGTQDFLDRIGSITKSIGNLGNLIN